MFITKLLVAALLVTTSSIALAKNCGLGKPCGNTCIAQHDVCHKDTVAQTGKAKAASRAPASETPTANTPKEPATVADPAPAASAASAKRPKTCKKGKACGNACIPEKAVCHAS